MYQLIYSSLALKDVKYANIANMLRAAALANKNRKITGCIILHQGEFLHLLEGEKVNVLSLFAKISNDTRHEHITVLYSSASGKRVFKTNLIIGDMLQKEMNLAGHQVLGIADFTHFKEQYQHSELAVRFFITLAETLVEKNG